MNNGRIVIAVLAGFLISSGLYGAALSGRVTQYDAYNNQNPRGAWSVLAYYIEQGDLAHVQSIVPARIERTQRRNFPGKPSHDQTPYDIAKYHFQASQDRDGFGESLRTKQLRDILNYLAPQEQEQKQEQEQEEKVVAADEDAHSMQILEQAIARANEADVETIRQMLADGLLVGRTLERARDIFNQYYIRKGLKPLVCDEFFERSSGQRIGAKGPQCNNISSSDRSKYIHLKSIMIFLKIWTE